MATTAFSYHPPPGGDISLRSSGGTIFVAHTLLLGMASSVFASMFTTANRSDVVELGDDAESVSLMLRFIYPPAFVDNLSLELIEKSLRMAQKYDIATITTLIDRLLSAPPDKNGLIYTEAAHVFCLAVTYGLHNTHKAAAERLRPEHFRINVSEDVRTIAAVCPDPSGVVGLLGARCVRAQSLAELLFGEEVIQSCFRSHNFESVIMCQHCFERRYNSDHIGSYEPTWLVYWNILAFNELTTKPRSDWDKLLSPACLDQIESRIGACSNCIEAAHASRDLFSIFANSVLSQAKDIIDDSESLYQL